VLEDFQTETTAENFPAHPRYGKCFGRIRQALALIPKTELQHSIMFYYLAGIAYKKMSKEIALKNIQLAKTFAAGLPSPEYDRWRKDLDVLSTFIEGMEEDEGEGEREEWKM
jgi:hypothetical protein